MMQTRHSIPSTNYLSSDILTSSFSSVRSPSFVSLCFSYSLLEMVKLGRRMNLRQQALATAQVYVRRFYIKMEIRRTNPYLLMTTAIYLACKMEECPIHIRLMLVEAARQWPGKSHLPDRSRFTKLTKCRTWCQRQLQDRGMRVSPDQHTLVAAHLTPPISEFG